MEPIYIVMISAGGVFGVLLLALVLYSIEIHKRNKQLRQDIAEAYSDEKVTKMEYDLAFYDDDTNKILHAKKTASQVTIDEVMGQEPQAATAEVKAKEAIFVKIGNEGVEEIRGDYKPENYS